MKHSCAFLQHTKTFKFIESFLAASDPSVFEDQVQVRRRQPPSKRIRRSRDQEEEAEVVSGCE